MVVLRRNGQGVWWLELLAGVNKVLNELKTKLPAAATFPQKPRQPQLGLAPLRNYPTFSIVWEGPSLNSRRTGATILYKTNLCGCRFFFAYTLACNWWFATNLRLYISPILLLHIHRNSPQRRIRDSLRSFP